jgi:hypothetical protein
MDYWYTAQLRNYRLQFIRAFSNFSYSKGKDADGNDILVRVPCRYGDPTRIAATIIKGNSENKLLTVPFITCWISGLAMSPTRRQGPSFVETLQATTREYNQNTQSYNNTQGNNYTIHRYMPVPYELSMTVDLWSNNESVKEQLVEQIMVLYNPAIDIQTSNNPLDWTVLSVIEMQDQITWSSRSIPVGTDNPIDVLTMVFKFPIWINPPAQVQKQNIIQNIVTTMIDGAKTNEAVEWTEYEFLSRQIVTPGDHSVKMSWAGNNQYNISLIGSHGSNIDPQKLATVTYSAVNPVLTPNTSFVWNNIKFPITTSSLSTFVDNAAALLENTSYNITIQNKNQLMFINNTGGNNVFSNDIGYPLAQLGLLEATYQGGDLAWWRLFTEYGKISTYNDIGINSSQIRFRLSPLENQSLQALGYIDHHPTNQNMITLTIDPASLPKTTLQAINAIVNPQDKGPNAGLPPAAKGQRYLLTELPGENTKSWGIIYAQKNDIVQFDGARWNVVFQASNQQSNKDYVTNLFTGKLIEWDGTQWSEYILPAYQPGYWRIAI